MKIIKKNFILKSQNYCLIDNYGYFNCKVKFCNFCGGSFMHKKIHNEMIDQDQKAIPSYFINNYILL